MIMKRLIKKVWAYVVMWALGLSFYLLPGKWISIEDDSPSYLVFEGAEGVMPGYPAFLDFFRRLFDEQFFLHGVVIAQSVLAAFCTFLFVLVLKRQFKLRDFESILLYLLSMLPFSIYLPEVGITHQIMTEGISYSVFYLFFITVIKAVWTQKYRWFLASMAVAVLLGLIRSQMIFLLAVCVLVLLWITFKRFGGKALCGLVLSFLILAVGIVLIFGPQIRNTSSQFNTVVMARGFYEADEEDADLFDDVMMQEIFRRTYELADENEHRYEYAKDGLYMWENLVYDRMNIYALQAIQEYDEKHVGERMRSEASIVFELGVTVLLKHFDRYLYHTVRLMMPSFIATVFFQIRPIYLLCHFITLFIYLFAIGGSIFAGKGGGDRRVVELSAVIVGILFIMVIMVNMMFIGLQRYMVYGMGIFYCAMYLLCKEMAWCFCEKSGKDWKWLKALIGERA